MELTNEFAAHALQVGAKQINTRSEVPWIIRQDALSRFSEKLVLNFHKLDSRSNVDAYLRSIAYTTLIDELRKVSTRCKYYTKLQEKAEFTESAFDITKVVDKIIDTA